MNTPHTSSAAGAQQFGSLPATARAPRTHGFTLVEMLVTLAVLGVLGAIAVSSWDKVGASMRLNAHASGFLAHFHYARSEAIKRNDRVVICKSAGGMNCENSGSWEQGWIVFHDANRNGLRDREEPVLKRGAALPRGWRIVGNQTVSRYLAFNPEGGTALANGGFQAGTINMCRESRGATEARQLVINAVGRPRIERAMLPQCG